jgi:hypothetical protein
MIPFCGSILTTPSGLGQTRRAESLQIGSQPCSPRVQEELLTWALAKGAAATLEVDMADQKLAEIDSFAAQFGMPVLDNEESCIGVLSKKALHGLQQVSVRPLPNLHYL